MLLGQTRAALLWHGWCPASLFRVVGCRLLVLAGPLNCADSHSPASLVPLSATASPYWPGLALSLYLPIILSIHPPPPSMHRALPHARTSLHPQPHIQLNSSGQPQNSHKHMHSHPGAHRQGDRHSSKVVERHNYAHAHAQVHMGLRTSH